VLITHGESGRSGVGRTRNVVAPTSLAGQFEQPYGPMGPPTLFTIPVLRYMKTYGLTHEQLAMVSVVQREWAAKNPRATFRTPITVEDVLNSRMIAYPFRLLQCCLVTDGGGALILVAAERARDFPQKPVYLRGTGESVETPMVSQMTSPPRAPSASPASLGQLIVFLGLFRFRRAAAPAGLARRAF
jgi:acetyl-CoA acetyltransferase